AVLVLLDGGGKRAAATQPLQSEIRPGCRSVAQVAAGGCESRGPLDRAQPAMSITALAVLLVYLGLIGLALVRHPIYALFAYLFIFYNDPQWNWRGSELPVFRYSLVAAVIGLLRSMSDKFSSEVTWTSTGRGRVWLLDAIWVWIQLPWAVGFATHLDGAILFTKYAALSYVMYRVIVDEHT